MAPTTRRQSARINNSSPAAPVTNSHVHFDSSDNERLAPKTNGVNGHATEEEELKQIEEQAKAEAEAEAQIQWEEAEEKEAEEEREEESEDEAPEAISNDASREAAKKREEDVRKAIEQQEETARQKRKRRDMQLKQQKAESKARKRAKTAHDEAITAEEGTAQDVADIAAIELKRAKKAPMLLPEAFLEELAARENEPQTRDVNSMAVMKSRVVEKQEKKERKIVPKKEKKERKIVPKKEKKEFKKGPVSVRVLKDDAKSRKFTAPPATGARSLKNNWLSGRGGVERKSVGGGFSRR